MFTGISDVLGREQLQEVRELLIRAEFVDGGGTAGYRAGRVKSNMQSKKGTEEDKRLRSIVIEGLISNSAFNEVTMPRSLNRPLFSRYLPGMEYGFHVDAAVMNKPDCLRTDISVTVFINEPDDYDGGELVVQTPYGPQSAKLKAGDAIVYPSNLLHRVMPVTRGERLAAVTWVQSYVRDAEKRMMLNELRHIQKTLHKHAPDDVGTDLSYKLHENLYRMWAET